MAATERPGDHADMSPAVDALIDEAERQPFTGWDFSWIEGRIIADPLPWDYTAAVVNAARHSPDLLDLGTGGGEWLADPRVCAAWRRCHRPQRCGHSQRPRIDGNAYQG
jgi:hypothetical protein